MANCLNISKGHFVGNNDLSQKTNCPAVPSPLKQCCLQEKYALISIQQIFECEIKKSHFK